MSEFLAVEDEMPSAERGRGTYDGLRDTVLRIAKDQSLHGKAIAIASFPAEQRQRANSAVQSLRNTYGNTSAAMGLTFAVRKLGDGLGVWVQMDPSAVVDGALAEHRTKVKAAAAKTKQKKAQAEKKAAAA